ncbi:MAG: protein kinase [Gemmataceae bacterium]
MNSPDHTEMDERSDAAIAAYLKARQSHAPARDTLLGDFPDCQEELERFIEDLQYFERAAAPIPRVPFARTLTGRHDETIECQALTGKVIGNQEIIRVLGQGGMGVVYLARHQTLHRLVALKTIRRSEEVKPQVLQRFRAEAEAVARLQHPSIVQVFEIGMDGDMPYFTMEYVEGHSLADRLAEGPMPTREAARLIATLARAMEHAHAHGIVHRDLKPANVLLTADNVPKISDFGLAKHQWRADNQTQTGAVLGTPSYLAPEQALGHKNVGPSADIHALGVLLYESLTGQPAFRGESPLDTMMLVASSTVVPPSKLSPRVPRDLETICLKCLHKEPRRRYASAAALADDLGSFLGGEAILARPIGALERTWLWCRRHPGMAGLAVTLVLVACLGLAGILWQWQRAEQHLDQAQREHRLAEDRLVQAMAAQQDAEAAGRRAEQEFHQAKKTIDDLAQDVFKEQVLHDTRLKGLRARLLQRAMSYYEDALKRQQEAGAPQAAVADACFQLGTLLYETDDRKQARHYLVRAQELREQLVARDGADAALRRRLIDSRLALARLEADEGQSAQAERSYRAAAKDIDQLLEATPADQQLTAQRDFCQLGLASLFQRSGRLEEALPEYLRAQGAQEARKNKSALQYSQLAACTKNVAALHLQLGHLDQARAEYDKARKILDNLVTNFPDNLRYRRDRLALSMDLAIMSQKPDAARKLYEEVLAELRKLAQRYPAETALQQDVALCYLNLGTLELGQAGRLKEAGVAVTQAQQRFGKLVANFPDVLDYRAKSIAATTQLGTVYLKDKRFLEAFEQFDNARRQARQLREGQPGDLAALQAESRAAAGWAQAAWRLDRRAEAIAALRHALHLDRQALQSTARADLRTHCLQTGYQLALYLQMQDRPAELLETLRGCAGDCGDQPTALYQTAQLTAQVAGTAKQQQQPALNDLALDLLRRAAANGFDDAQRLRNEPAFAALATEPRFVALVKQLSQK